MNIISEERCERCRFSRGVAGRDGINAIACFRFPPTFFALPTTKGIGEICKNPDVKPDGWCGEFRPRVLS